MEKRIFLSSPHMSDEGYELTYIHDAFQKNWIAPLGENVNEFEKVIGSYIGKEYAVALASGTAALHLALLQLGVGGGDLVFCQDLTFSASANPIAYVGAKPVFIDCERDTWNMDPRAFEKAISLYGKPKAVIVVHLYGNPAKMDEIQSICQTHGIPLIEDAAEALGSIYHGQKCGSFGVYGALSFNGNKIITTSGGGMLICSDKDSASHVLKLATQAREPVAWYQHEEIGFNYRMSNICAGIGRGQAKVLEYRIAQKRAIFQRYVSNLKNLPIQFQSELEESYSNRWLSVMLLEEGCGVSVKDVLDALQVENIEARHVWKPMHAQPIFKDAPFVSTYDSAVSDDLFMRGVCLPSDTKMTMEDVDRVSQIIKSLFKE